MERRAATLDRIGWFALTFLLFAAGGLVGQVALEHIDAGNGESQLADRVVQRRSRRRPTSPCSFRASAGYGPATRGSPRRCTTSTAGSRACRTWFESARRSAAEPVARTGARRSSRSRSAAPRRRGRPRRPPLRRRPRCSARTGACASSSSATRARPARARQGVRRRLPQGRGDVPAGDAGHPAGGLRLGRRRGRPAAARPVGGRGRARPALARQPRRAGRLERELGRAADRPGGRRGLFDVLPAPHARGAAPRALERDGAARSRPPRRAAPCSSPG